MPFSLSGTWCEVDETIATVEEDGKDGGEVRSVFIAGQHCEAAAAA